MDPVTLIYYAIICGCLGIAAPWLGSLPLRLGIGGAVGLIAAALLPSLRGAIGI